MFPYFWYISLNMYCFILQPPVLPSSDEVAELMQKLKNEILLRNAAEAEVDSLNEQLIQWKNIEVLIELVTFFNNLTNYSLSW